MLSSRRSLPAKCPRHLVGQAERRHLGPGVAAQAGRWQPQGLAHPLQDAYAAALPEPLQRLRWFELPDECLTPASS